MVAKTEKLDRRHGFEDVDLTQQHLLNFHHPVHCALGRACAVFVHQPHGRIYFVQDHLEPQFVRLMNRDEQQLVVMHGIGETILQIDQIGNS